jgi:hypothetical protein
MERISEVAKRIKRMPASAHWFEGRAHSAGENGRIHPVRPVDQENTVPWPQMLN